MDEKRKSSLDINSLEKNLPFYLWNDIQNYLKGEVMDCVIGEFDADLRQAMRENRITWLQKEFLIKKYFQEASEEELRAWFEEEAMKY